MWSDRPRTRLHTPTAQPKSRRMRTPSFSGYLPQRAALRCSACERPARALHARGRRQRATQQPSPPEISAIASERDACWSARMRGELWRRRNAASGGRPRGLKERQSRAACCADGTEVGYVPRANSMTPSAGRYGRRWGPEDLAPHLTSWKCGGPARYVANSKNYRCLARILVVGRFRGLPGCLQCVYCLGSPGKDFGKQKMEILEIPETCT